MEDSEILSDDYIRMNLTIGVFDFFAEVLGIDEWPPPKFMCVSEDGGGMLIRVAKQGDDWMTVLYRRSYSVLTGEQSALTSHLARGAEYDYLHTL